MKVMTKILWMMLVLLLATASAHAEQQIVARVGGLPITMLEFAREYNKIMPLAGSYHGGVDETKKEEVREKSMDKLIVRTLKARYAIDNEIAGDAKYVSDKLADVIKAAGSEENLIRGLDGITIQEVRASFFRDSLAKQAELAVVDNKITVTDEEVKSYYEANKHKFNRPKQFEASHILIKVDPAANADERATLEAKARALYERAVAGEDFYNLAYYNSDDQSRYVGGSLGTFHHGQTVAEFDEALKSMKAGDISEPVRSLYGFHIISLKDVQEQRQLTFEEVKDKIHNTIYEKQRKKLYSDWVASLRESYKVEKLIKF